ncbi:MAG: hypothetical protein LBH59_10695 [Planctomycetaceae bacterium]|nr:hypothetical protein [Planctomycetaceae bacterium]
MNKRSAMLRLPCSALRILKRLQHNSQISFFIIINTHHFFINFFPCIFLR